MKTRFLSQMLLSAVFWLINPPASGFAHPQMLYVWLLPWKLLVFLCISQHWELSCIIWRGLAVNMGGGRRGLQKLTFSNWPCRWNFRRRRSIISAPSHDFYLFIYLFLYPFIYLISFTPIQWQPQKTEQKQAPSASHNSSNSQACIPVHWGNGNPAVFRIFPVLSCESGVECMALFSW